MNEACSTCLGDLLNVKHELNDMNVEPTVLQHMDIHYRNTKISSAVTEENAIGDDLNKLVPFNRVKNESIEDKLRGNVEPVQCSSITSMQSQIYTCDVCKKTIKTKAAIRSHVQRVHGTSHLKCPECNKYYRCRHYLNHHILNVHGQHHLKYESCGKVFKRMKNLAKHIDVPKNKTVDSSSGLYVCDCCLKKFRSKSDLVYHLQYIVRCKSYRCKLCRKNFKNQLYLSSHTKQVHGGEEHKSQQTQTYKCGECLKVFKAKKYLWYHHKRIHGTQSHKCSQCNKEFKCKAYLIKHVRNTHSEEQYKCDICKKIYKSRAAMYNHLSIYHRNRFAGSHARNYTCDHCQKSFWRKHTLEHHMTTVHGERNHRCQKCTKNFKSRHHLLQHKTTIHGAVLHECEVCHRIFTTKYTLRAHVTKAHGLNDIKFHLHSKEVRVPCPIAADMSAVGGTGSEHHEMGTVKSEPAEVELELVPVMFQHMDSNNRPLKEESKGN